MALTRSLGLGSYHAAILAALPWIWLYRPAWTAVAVALALVAHRHAVRTAEGEPWRSAVVAASCLAALVAGGGWAVAGAWLVLAVGAGLATAVVPGVAGWGRPDAIDLAAAAAVGAAFALRPDLMAAGHGGWVAPVVLVLAGRRLGGAQGGWRRPQAETQVLGPPCRDIRGTVTLTGAVAGPDGLQRTVPLDLEIRAGRSLAIVCENSGDAADLAATVSGRRAPIGGEYCIDGCPPEAGDRLVAVVGPAEPFVAGSLTANLEALLDEPLSGDRRVAVRDACSLEEVEQALGDDPIPAGGGRLSLHHRLMIQIARVLASHYRILVVLDPMADVSPVRAELWRNAVVRASVGRTAIWVTPDRSLAHRAEAVFVLRHGTLRPEKGGT